MPAEVNLPSRPAPCPQTQVNQQTTQPLTLDQPPSTTQHTTTNATGTANQKRSGRQPGSQGYSGADCTALVAIVKDVLPLGSNKWDNVHFKYSQYAMANGQTVRDVEPLKTKEAKRVNLLIKDRAKNLAFVDEDGDEEVESDDERNGVGNPIPLSPDDTLLLGWDATHPELPVDPANTSVEESDSVAPSGTGMATQAPSTNVGDLGARDVANSSHRDCNTLVHCTQSCLSGSTGTLPIDSSNCRSRSSQASGLHDSLAAYFNPEACEARERESSMTQFYEVRLQEATATINRLQDEATKLRKGINMQVLRLQDDLEKARSEVAQKNSENQELCHRLEMMQLWMEFQSHSFFQPGMISSNMAQGLMNPNLNATNQAQPNVAPAFLHPSGIPVQGNITASYIQPNGNHTIMRGFAPTSALGNPPPTTFGTNTTGAQQWDSTGVAPNQSTK
ncbi:uncharacterized protein PGTG_15905 [Puccinia graminis f. sp. tritici CRL 75-36-700-3]|uniref:Uncharacterized protein n=1 Tax=Puccinia graminis f. sp. tritici (strain CRL 75-36-700-3 / race SCCL) TaxID=418459 RepID=E3L0F9_PUCGT|nr:uncharacterized protein PGTG_15905 [Puccinia graminis f. sp. tritici CRL 75-36-700-3]EFP90057.1 hypothetical protein PGTG_15905 [Puccinia graminis f. sp. tritici CRL 75-36-700-3]